jgi:hypothetical protein
MLLVSPVTRIGLVEPVPVPVAPTAGETGVHVTVYVAPAVTGPKATDVVLEVSFVIEVIVGVGGGKYAIAVVIALWTPSLDVSYAVQMIGAPFVAKPVWLGQLTEPSPRVPESVKLGLWVHVTDTEPPATPSPTVESEADVGPSAMTVTVGAGGAKYVIAVVDGLVPPPGPVDVSLTVQVTKFDVEACNPSPETKYGMLPVLVSFPSILAIKSPSAPVSVHVRVM